MRMRHARRSMRGRRARWLRPAPVRPGAPARTAWTRQRAPAGRGPRGRGHRRRREPSARPVRDGAARCSTVRQLVVVRDAGRGSSRPTRGIPSCRAAPGRRACGRRPCGRDGRATTASVEAALELAQVREQRRDLGGRRSRRCDAAARRDRGRAASGRSAATVSVRRVAVGGSTSRRRRRRGDDVDVEVGERDAGGARDAVEAPAHDVQRVLGGKEQHAPGRAGGEAAQARHAGGDRDGHVEREERLAALRLAADDADRLSAQRLVDEPAPLLGAARRARGRGARAARSSAGLARAAAVGDAGSSVGGGEDLEVELLVELLDLALGARRRAVRRPCSCRTR